MNQDWQIFKKGQSPGDYLDRLPDPPPWRQFKGKPDPNYEPVGVTDELRSRGTGFQTDEKGAMVRMVNAALYLRRPLLITGDPGAGKSTLIYAVAHQLQLGDVLKWPITSRSTLQQGLYQYDAIGRLQSVQMAVKMKELQSRTDWTQPASSEKDSDSHPLDIGDYIKLGALGTALLPTERPRALLIDEIDKSDLDLPNDLLHVFEEGEYVIPELERLREDSITVKDYHGRPVTIPNGRVKCRAFPFVVMTSNGEREFPPPFLRRCLRLDMPRPDEKMLGKIISARLEDRTLAKKGKKLVQEFLKRKEQGALATDQLLNAVYLLKDNRGITPKEYDELLKALLRELSGAPIESPK
jgi:MoxR-like ATPase